MLTDAPLANAKLREEGESLIAAYIEPESDRQAIINDLIRPLRPPRAARGAEPAVLVLEEARATAK